MQKSHRFIYLDNSPQGCTSGEESHRYNQPVHRGVKLDFVNINNVWQLPPVAKNIEAVIQSLHPLDQSQAL